MTARKASVTAIRYHDISCGHRVVGHESKCALLHGHNYRVHFTCRAEVLDDVGRVVDFSVIKQKLCMWLEDNWDHRFLAYENDALMRVIQASLDLNPHAFEREQYTESIVWVPFNPTAENMALHLLQEVGPKLFIDSPYVRLMRVRIEETRKCSAEARYEK